MRRLFFPLTTILASVLLQNAVAQNTSPYWSLAGNSNASSSSKLGTTNSNPLRLTTNNSVRLYINANGSVGIGTTSPVQRLDVNGNINIRKGYGLHMENHPVLRVDSSLASAFLGNSAGVRNTGISNTGVGGWTLSSGNSGAYNSAFGYAALNFNTSGYSNTATGSYALSINGTGYQNTASGHYALYVNRTGANNTAMGYAALANTQTGDQNVAVGQGALAMINGSSLNTALGTEAMYESAAGAENVAVGYRALLKSGNGSRNVAVGSNALAFNNNSWYNTAIGDYAGGRFIQGWNNTFIGSDADATFGGAYNTVAIGNSAKVTAPNQVRIGNAYTTSIGGFTTWTNLSDGRVTRNVQENVPGLAFINKLKPVTYNLDLDVADRIMGVTNGKDKNSLLATKQVSQLEMAARQAKQQVVYTGFIAQDVEKAAKELNFNFSGVDAAKNEKDLYGLRYTDFVMPLVKAVQELSKENNELKNRLEKLEATTNSKQLQTTPFQSSKISVGDNASLQQNTPNPATSSTRITYTLPKTSKQAHLLLTDGSGKMIKTLALTSSGVVTVDTTRLNSGTYNYSLIVDGDVLETKRLTVVR